ncbi:hypothetical protein GCM10011416_06600 [Polaribacter pacificus]|uniref:Glycine dehydrogenase n=1 Tax=Polaribacter pacificus TaxID=1775173 RepID=A0A917HVJ3_9FLAO|nr:hypothetical protein [Polaribacter pacificus]GGG92365.1 hypothetical protein GCM10011416_06600 [Polaribacter pacificus]
MLKKLQINCDKATTICDKSQYGEATLFEKIQLSWHLLVCKLCSSYVKQNKSLTKVFKIKAADCKEQKCMSQKDKEALKKELEKVKS